MKKEILKLRGLGKTYSEISEILGCSKSTISHHCGVRGSYKRLAVDAEDLQRFVEESISFLELCRKIKIKETPSNCRKLKNICNKNKISTEHFKGQSWGKGKKRSLKEVDLFIKERLVLRTSKSSTHHLKNNLYKYNLKDRICEVCGISEVWQGKFLSLHIDHIDGNRLNDCLDNLRILCPNCHSQTHTYAGKNSCKKGVPKR